MNIIKYLIFITFIIHTISGYPKARKLLSANDSNDDPSSTPQQPENEILHDFTTNEAWHEYQLQTVEYLMRGCDDSRVRCHHSRVRLTFKNPEHPDSDTLIVSTQSVGAERGVSGGNNVIKCIQGLQNGHGNAAFFESKLGDSVVVKLASYDNGFPAFPRILGPIKASRDVYDGRFIDLSYPEVMQMVRELAAICGSKMYVTGIKPSILENNGCHSYAVLQVEQLTNNVNAFHQQIEDRIARLTGLMPMF